MSETFICGIGIGVCFGVLLSMHVPFLRRMCAPSDFRTMKAKRQQEEG